MEKSIGFVRFLPIFLMSIVYFVAFLTILF